MIAIGSQRLKDRGQLGIRKAFLDSSCRGHEARRESQASHDVSFHVLIVDRPLDEMMQSTQLPVDRHRARLPSATSQAAIEQASFEHFAMLFLQGDYGKVLFDQVRSHKLIQGLCHDVRGRLPSMRMFFVISVEDFPKGWTFTKGKALPIARSRLVGTLIGLLL